jgi:hypothetical protein
MQQDLPNIFDSPLFSEEDQELPPEYCPRGCLGVQQLEDTGDPTVPRGPVCVFYYTTACPGISIRRDTNPHSKHYGEYLRHEHCRLRSVHPDGGMGPAGY